MVSIKKIAYKFKAFLFSKDALNFLLFLLLSTAFWFSHAVSKARQNNVSSSISIFSRDSMFVKDGKVEVVVEEK